MITFKFFTWIQYLLRLRFFILSNTVFVHREQLKELSHTITYDYTNMSTRLHTFIEFSCSMIILLTQRGNVLCFCVAIYNWDIPFFGWNRKQLSDSSSLKHYGQVRQSTATTTNYNSWSRNSLKLGLQLVS